MNFNLQVSFSDGTTREVAGKAADIVAFETKFDMSMSSLQKDVKITHLFFLAWHAEKRTGATTLDFDAWLDTVEMVTAADPK
jgi:hypothetical protein